MAKQLNTRIQHKYDKKANWDNATFSPLAGELIIYSDGKEGNSNVPAIKIGDGKSLLKDLKFVEGSDNTASYPKVKVKFYYYSTKDDTTQTLYVPFGTYNDNTYIYKNVRHELVNGKDTITVEKINNYNSLNWQFFEYEGILYDTVKNQIQTNSLTTPTCTVGKVPGDNANDWYIYSPVTADVYNMTGMEYNSEVTWTLKQPNLSSSYSMTTLCSGYAIVYRTGDKEDNYKYSLFNSADANTVGKVNCDYFMLNDRELFKTIQIMPTVVEDSLRLKITITNEAGSTLTNIGDNTIKQGTPVKGRITQEGNDYIVELYTYLSASGFDNIYADSFTMFDAYSEPENDDNPCLIEGTLITMADGSQKPIEDIKNGDMVLSYDPNTGEQVSTAVLFVTKTGVASEFNVYSFTDGNCLTVYGMHGIYDAYRGYPIDIRKIERSCYFLNIDGEKIKWTDTIQRTYHGFPKARYGIYTTNNLYYANDVLLGNSGYFKLDRLIYRHLTRYIPKNILSVWQQDAEDYNSLTEFMNNKEFRKATKDLMSNIALAKSVISINKDRLTKSDYKVQKHSEGVLSDKEFEKSKTEREAFRLKINQQESILKTSREEYHKLIDAYRQGKTKKTVFEDCCKRDNELLPAIQEHIKTNGYLIPEFTLQNGVVKVRK